jgi:hypothetical protein
MGDGGAGQGQGATAKAGPRPWPIAACAAPAECNVTVAIHVLDLVKVVWMDGPSYTDTLPIYLYGLSADLGGCQLIAVNPSNMPDR